MGGRRKPTLRCEADRNSLVEKWSGLPRFVVRRLKHRLKAAGLHPDDAEQDGAMALLRAAELWDETRGVKFCSYAANAIARRVLLACRRASLIHVPDHPGRFGESAARARCVLSFDGNIDLPAPEREPPDTDELRRLRCNLRRLPHRQRQVLTLRYGEGLTLREAGVRLGGLSRERVRQIQAAGMATLRRLMGVAA